jgi:hypothetical protein
MFRTELIRWLKRPRLAGWNALSCAIVAVAIPTAVRAAVEGTVTGCEFTPYLPFIFLCAILTPWWAAAGAASASVAVLGGISAALGQFMPRCFIDAAMIFLASSAVMIGTACLVRSTIAALQKRGADESSGGIVFSLENGQVWASWYGQAAPVLLGSRMEVSAMMSDFLAQEELARRLSAY